MGKYSHLTTSDRHRIEIYLGLKWKISAIAKKLNRDRSSIYRELKRNTKTDSYQCSEATKLAKKRCSKGVPNKIKTDRALKNYVERSLKKGWSPDQISEKMKKEKKEFYVCQETIYQYIYQEKERKLYQLLSRQKSARRRQSRRKTPKNKILFDLHSIHKRPTSVNTREEFGHWEGDTIRFFNTQKSSVTTLVERKSRFVRLKKNKDNFSETVVGNIGNIRKEIPARMWKTLTLDQGPEFANYYQLIKQKKCEIYYCDPRSPWQKGGNENMNGRIRRYLPTKTPIDQLDEKTIKQIEKRLNNTPRKCLNYQTPREVYTQFCRTSR